MLTILLFAAGLICFWFFFNPWNGSKKSNSPCFALITMTTASKNKDLNKIET